MRIKFFITAVCMAIGIPIDAVKFIGPPGSNQISGSITLSFTIKPSTSLSLMRNGNIVTYAYESNLDGGIALYGKFNVDKYRTDFAFGEGAMAIAYREREQRQKTYLADSGKDLKTTAERSEKHYMVR